MRKLAGVLLFIAPLYLHAQIPFKVSGKIGALNAPARIVLSYTDSSEIMVTVADTLKDGRFGFSGYVAYPTRASLTLYKPGEPATMEQPDIITLYLDSEPVKVTTKDSVKKAVVKGSALNKQYSNLLSALQPFNKRLTALSEANDRYAAEKGNAKATMPGMTEKWAAVANEKKAVIKKFIAENPGSYLSLEMMPVAVSWPYQLEELEPAFNALTEAVRNTPSGKKLAEHILKMKEIGVGSIAPDFVQKDTSGIPVKLSAFRGKYVLIDFWASWCVPCRADNRILTKIFNQYKDRNFTVLGVSLDRPGDKEKWQKAIVDDRLVWTNVSDLAYWKNSAARLYGVLSIPQNYLVDPSGMIIAVNLHGKELEEKLRELFP